MRISTIDGLRGYFILMMMMVHLTTIQPFLRLFTHHRFGYVEDAQGFVFLSGIVVALAYGRILQRTSFDEMRRKLFSRVGKLFVYNVLSLAVVFGLAFGGFAFSDQIREFARIGATGWHDVILGVLLFDGPTFVDILPMYICFMLVAPFALRALYGGNALFVIGVSTGLWVMAQSGVFDAFANWGTGALAVTPDGGFDLSLYFFRWSWQILFFAGLTCGALYARGKLDLSVLHQARFERLFFLSLLAIAFFALLRVNGRFGPMASPLLEAGLDRSNLGLLRLANFAADAYAFTYLAVAGTASRHRWIAVPAQVLHSVLSWRPLVFLGQHSLQAYALHVVLVYLVAAFMFRFDLSFGPGIGDAILIACWAALFVPGLWIVWRRKPRISPAHA